jgi:hypothetical protein
MSVSPEERQIGDYLNIRSAIPGRADLAFIFGTRYPEPAQIALELFEKNVIEYVVLTGGINRLAGINEARAHRDFLLASGVTDQQMIVEDNSTNTLENVLNAHPLIEERIGFDRIQTVIVLTKWYHVRRAMMTLKRHFPDGIRYYPLTYIPAGIDPDDWSQQDPSRQRVLKEWHAIPKYLNKGDIAEIQPEGQAYV